MIYLMISSSSLHEAGVGNINPCRARCQQTITPTVSYVSTNPLTCNDSLAPACVVEKHCPSDTLVKEASAGRSFSGAKDTRGQRRE